MKGKTALCDRFDVASNREATAAACVNFLRQIFVYHDLTHAEKRNMLKATKKDYRRNVKSNMNIHLSIALNISSQILKLNNIRKSRIKLQHANL